MSTHNVFKQIAKWAISREEYPDDHYPQYCSGFAWIMSTDVIIALDRTADIVPFFRVDDVFITGLLTARLPVGVTWVQFDHAYIIEIDDRPNAFEGPHWYRDLFVHLTRTENFRKVWRKMLRSLERYPIPVMTDDLIRPGRIVGSDTTPVVKILATNQSVSDR